MDTEAGRQILGATFYQCRAAREAKMTETIFDLTTGLKKTEPYKRIETMDRQEDRLLGKTFHGARANKYSKGISVEVNQGITCSYDPATLICMMCSTEHKITEERHGGLPATLVFSDQNFISGFSGDGSSCVSVCRLENCSLVELTDMVVEVLEGINLKPGTVILMGSTTHLHRVGVSMYAGDWASCVERLEQKWGGGVHVCPLIPLLFCESPPELAIELTELAVWLVEIYKGSPKSLGDTWSSLVGFLSTAATGGGGPAGRCTPSCSLLL
jgi:hypothetical protein